MCCATKSEIIFSCDIYYYVVIYSLISLKYVQTCLLYYVEVYYHTHACKVWLEIAHLLMKTEKLKMLPNIIQ